MPTPDPALPSGNYWYNGQLLSAAAIEALIANLSYADRQHARWRCVGPQ